jgi:hypothetical protein
MSSDRCCFVFGERICELYIKYLKLPPYGYYLTGNNTTVHTLLQKLSKSQYKLNSNLSGFGGLGVGVLASSTQVRGFKPGRSRRIFKGGKISPRLPSEGK